jgi:hypothetical protein
MVDKRIHIESKWFFNDPRSNADFGYWSMLDCWNQEEALALSFGKDPKLVDWWKIRDYERVYRYIREYKERRILLIRAIRAGILKRPMPPDSFVKWAEAKGLSIPDELIFFVEVNKGIAASIEADAPAAPSQILGGDATAAQNRKDLDISGARGSRRRILEQWSQLVQLHGPKPTGRDVLRRLNQDK